MYGIIQIVGNRQTGRDVLNRVWPILFEKKGNFRQKLEAALPFDDFLPKEKKKTVYSHPTYMSIVDSSVDFLYRVSMGMYLDM